VPSAYAPWAVQKRIGLADARLALDSVLMPRPNLSYIDYRSGVMASGDTAGVGGSSHMAMRVKPVSGSLAVTVEMGNAVINTPSEGAYMCVLDSVKTLMLSASSSTTNRIDLIVARVYDDLNSAIASDVGVRKFVVEVWEGDPATGTPTVPTPTPTAGWHPLAAVTVGRDAATLTTANIQDLRGPGLVARGGMRGLYGADAVPGSGAFAEAGAYPGDQRWVHTNGFQHQVYYGAGSDPRNSGWRGVHNCMVYDVSPAPGGMLWTRGLNARRVLCETTIPYPGTPFMIYPTARGFLTVSPGCAVDLSIELVTGSELPVNWTRVNNFGETVDHIMVPTVPPKMWGPWTDTLTVRLTGIVRETPGPFGGFGYQGDDVDATQLSVCVYPSVVQPPAV
jgi:hypothetical protein